MAQLFDNNRTYAQDDPEIVRVLGSPEHQAQSRYHNRYPPFFRIGRRILLSGKDLNAWCAAQRVDNQEKGAA